MAVWNGRFTPQSGEPFDIKDLKIELADIQDRQMMRWTTLGPYANPFDPMNRIGGFQGTVALELKTWENEVLYDPEPMKVSFVVKPSVRIKYFGPSFFPCGAPVERALTRIPYRVEAEGIGFTPTSFRFQMVANSNPQPTDGTNSTVVVFDETRDADPESLSAGVGEEHNLSTPNPPDGQQSYTATLRVSATDGSGNEYQNAFAFIVHSPIEFYPAGPSQLAQVEPPQVIVGCYTAASLTGAGSVRTFSFAESRANAISFGTTEGWLSSKSLSNSKGSSISTTGGSVTVDNYGFILVENFSNTRSSANVTLGATETSGEDKDETKRGFDVWSNNAITSVIGKGSQGEQDSGGNSSTSGDGRNDVGNADSTTTTDLTTRGRSETNSGGLSISRNGSSSQSESEAYSTVEANGDSIGTFIIPYASAAYFVQRQRWMTPFNMYGFNVCGASELAGEIRTFNWLWPVSPVQGASCGELDTSKLEPTGCHIQPCDNAGPE